MRNKAFTLVELIAATALSTLLFIAALSVIRTLGRTSSTSASLSRAWTLSARQQLEWDFKNAIVFRQDSHGLILGGYGSLDPQSLAPTHLPVLVIYSLRTIGSSNWLVREQESVDPAATDLDFSELLCGNVKSFTMTGSYAPRNVPVDAATSAAEDPTPVVFQQISDTQRLPDRVRLRLDLTTDPMPVMNSIIFVK